MTSPHAEREARPLSLDERIAAEDRQCASNCGACLNQCGDAPDGLPFVVAVIRRDLWTALRFASTDQAIAQLDEQASRLGIAPCGDAESVTDFHLRIVDATVATIRASTLAEVRAGVEGEEEADGPMPDAMWETFKVAATDGTRQRAEVIIRGTIAATKKSILALLDTLAGTNG